MTTAIDSLIAIAASHDVPHELLGVADVLGAKNIRVLAIELLSWLKRQRRFRNEKPLKLSPQHTWCQDLPELLELYTPLSDLFEIVGATCNFRNTVCRSDREQLRERVDTGYRPVLRTIVARSRDA